MKPFATQLSDPGYSLESRDVGTMYKEFFRVLEDVNLGDGAHMKVFHALEQALANCPAVVRALHAEGGAETARKLIKELKEIKEQQVQLDHKEQ